MPRNRFATDAPLEGDGFEPTVPPRRNPVRSEIPRDTDSPLEGAGFELLVPQSTRSVVLTPDDMAGQYPSCLFSTRTSHKSGARQCYRSRVVTPSTERPVSSKLNAWSCRRAFRS